MSASQPALSLIKSLAYVDGRWCESLGGRRFEVLNPATGQVITQVPDMDGEDTHLAIAAAHAAQPAWAALTAKERSSKLYAWFERIMANQEELARIMTCEQGKPLAEAKGEVAYGASFIQWFAEEGKRAYGRTIPGFSADRRLATIKQPVGVVAAITPWNFPIAMITRKAGPALAAGCTIVIKPAAETPLCALALAVLAEQAGIPAGVINIVTSHQASAVGNELCSNPVVRKLSFTGSTRIGKLLMRQCADTMKRLSLELGGNAPFIVFDDADLDAAVAGALASKYRNAGQTCVCANRILVQASVYDAFAEKLAAAVKAFKVGDGMGEGVQIGPLINPAAASKVAELVQQSVAAGARVLVGGDAHPAGPLFYHPTILTGVTRGNPILDEEIFGPVAPLVRFETEAEAIALANDTPYGLAAYFYGRDIARVWRVAEGLEYGMVGINEGIISTELAPFGGIKESGLGREGAAEGLEEYLETKYLCFGGIR
ncbi:NAD-dependent succinate-semialdehyde dehydrogenase [Aeromonas caviae]|uniref:NAD-dependent succinate-semialdehyde dehydrogenase n=1 Tax=Aeromonas caviae TaxID=648 RepID=A0ABD0BBF5_AERCA|nr:NAD-dependent succinate-semialdehyde dehydrogenase [Aeromonas caviae]MDX7649081.1 NAD-dependent succinate-semialdehyde dehydrogenase [Aeromonas caviae]BCR28206.1 NAD-dependent succinate-semialdehyde dehydrogenase [Aeromonas caviae]GJA82631.1 NAD-dependent succinate-semialdehyde dehydrogenase [Aeromonas caviae]GJB00217.1 NAD-dependent succinate-semialdehyde dehydrogenase [Aeromonas caviae]GJB12700.1 NAD-dependent succinate-semialdehyde dehydrogenase [Aeromonas caviae]